MKKKILLMFIAVILGFFGFAATFAFAWLSKPQTVAASDDAATTAAQNANAVLAQMQVSVEQESIATNSINSLTEKQLKSLVFEVREKIDQYNVRLKELDLRERRMQVAQDTLRSDIAEMSDLRVELASAVTALKSEQDNLTKKMVQIEQVEQDNLKQIALMYDSMDSEAAGRIITNMIQTQHQGSGFNDAVKILYYMTERPKAKLLASISESEPAVSAVICQKLKHTTESN
ncbi:MAG: hypothetical protein ACYSUT_03630 [Planctomycetota bacterium]